METTTTKDLYLFSQLQHINIDARKIFYNSHIKSHIVYVSLRGITVTKYFFFLNWTLYIKGTEANSPSWSLCVVAGIVIGVIIGVGFIVVYSLTSIQESRGKCFQSLTGQLPRDSTRQRRQSNQFRNWKYRNYSISFVSQHPPFP